MFPRLGLAQDRQSYPQAFAQSTPFSESIFQFNNNGQASYLKGQPCMSAPTLGQSISLPIPISQLMPTKQRMPISQPMPINQPTAQQLTNPAGSFPHQIMPINYPTAQQPSNPVGSFSHQPMPINQPTVQQPSIPVSSFSRYLSQHRTRVF